MTGASKDNGYMMATNLVGVRGSWERSRVPALPVVVNLLYALEPVVAALCLICLSPFLVILALAIRAASGASPLVAHRRVGRHGTTLWVYKFRSMWPRGGYAHRSAFLVEKV